MQKIFTLILISLFANSLQAQKGRVEGTVTDSKTGETLPGATILIDGTGKAAITDFDGKFSFNNLEAGKVTLAVSYISYTSKKIADVTVKAGDVTEVNVTLDPSSSKDLSEVEVVVTLNKENNTALVLQQKNSAAVSDGISNETIKRSPDRSTSDALKRVSGVTIQDDKFVIIRGLNERYNASYLNGAPLPSTEPDKKAFSFDLFPANMLDNIVINKTATPDMPAEFAGGIVQINTKSIPEKNFFLVSGSGGYNTLATGKEKLIYTGGKYDAFGIDDGSRAIPTGVPNLDQKASWITNSDQARVAKYWNNDWGYSKSTFAPNYNFQIAGGYNIKRKEQDFLGIIFSLSNNNTQSFYNLQRNEYTNLLVSNNVAENVQNETKYANKVYQTQAATGGLLNFALKLNPNNTIGFKNLLTSSGDNRFIYAVGQNLNDAAEKQNRLTSRFLTINRIASSQLTGEHYLSKSKLKINWNMGASSVVRSVPNLRMMSYTRNLVHNPDNPDYSDTLFSADIATGQNAGPNYAGYRVYSQLNETMYSGKADVSRLFKLDEKNKIDVKAGVLYQQRHRQFDIRQFGLNAFSQGSIRFDNTLTALPEDSIFAAENMSVTPSGKGGFKATEITKPDDNYTADSKLSAAYVMGEWKHGEKIRLVGGIRFESYFQTLHVQYGKIDSTLVKNTVNDILPSLNFIYNITEKLGLRLSYYKTLNRAEFRELAVTSWFDPETRLSLAGNASLTRCYIQNADARFEVYPGRGQLFTVTGFYKYFNSPIERYMLGNSENQIYYRNANFANIYGSELEYRINVGAILNKDSIPVLNNLNLFSNLSLIKSIVNVAGINDKVPDTRAMQGQAPYIINGGISYIDTKNNFSITGMLNRVGQRIYIVGNDIIPNRWEKPRTVVDMQLTKSFLKNKLELRLNIKDLLHQDYIIFYKGNDRKDSRFDKNVDYVNFQRNYGSTYSFIVSYKF